MQQCKNCGMLSLKRHEDGFLIEANEDYRRDRVMITAYKSRSTYEEIPICFARSTSLLEECGGDAGKETVLSVINKDRSDCVGYIAWSQGFSPKEHIEMERIRSFQEAQDVRDTRDREWRERQAEIDRQWRESQAAQEHQWRREDLARDREWRIEDRSLAKTNLFVASSVGIASAIATLIASKLMPWWQ